VLDRRSDREILREIRERKEGSVAGLFARTRRLVSLSALSTHVIEAALVALIIAIVASWMISTFVRARQTARITTCLENLNQIGYAIQLYHLDYDAYPPSESWYDALRARLGPLKPSEDPLKCGADNTADPVSYHYLARSFLPYDQQTKSPCTIPLVVDETYHANKATVLWYDYHQTAISKAQWVHTRSAVLGIRRDTTHPDRFRYIPKGSVPTTASPNESD